MSGAKNGIVGNEYGIDLPETVVNKDELVDEKRMAKFSRTREFKELKEYINRRIEFYQTQLPDGRALTGVHLLERQNMWLTANCVVAEMKLIIDAYESASEAVANAN